MLEIWGMRSILSLPLLSAPLRFILETIIDKKKKFNSIDLDCFGPVFYLPQNSFYQNTAKFLTRRSWESDKGIKHVDSSKRCLQPKQEQQTQKG